MMTCLHFFIARNSFHITVYWNDSFGQYQLHNSIIHTETFGYFVEPSSDFYISYWNTCFDAMA